MIKKTFLFIIMICTLSMLINCGGNGGNGAGSSEVTLSATFIKSPSSLLRTSSTLTRIRYTVSGPGMRVLTGNIPVQGDLVEFVLNVPNGPERRFVIEALDAEEHVRYSGEAYADLDGRPITLLIELLERVLDVSGDWLFYRTTLGETQEKGPFCRRITQGGDVLSVFGYETDIGEISGSGTLRGNNIELMLSFMACDNEGTITITATTDGNTMNGTFTLTGGCLDIPINGSWRAERGECSLPKAEVSVRIAYFEDTYSLDFFADTVSDVQITAAAVTGPHVGTLNLDYTCSVGHCRWFAISSFGQTIPATGDTYSFSLQYNDGTSDVLNDSVYDLGVGVPVPLSPQHGETVETTTPTFSWQPPAWGCASWYHLIVRDNSGNDIWWPAIPGDTTSAVYNFDGKATQALTPGESYSWVVNAFDDCEHHHMGHINFAGADGGIFTVSTGGGGTTTYNMVNYFSLGLGDTWTYEEDFGGFYTRTVSGTETVNGTVAQKLEVIGEGYKLFTNDSNGLRQYQGYKIEDGSWIKNVFDPPIIYAPAEVSVGANQSFTSLVSYSDSDAFFSSGTISGTSTIEGIEDVIVPAGTFKDCLRIKITENYALSGGSVSLTTTFTLWLAQGVGIVKDTGSETTSVFGQSTGTLTWDEKLASATVGGVSYPVPLQIKK